MTAHHNLESLEREQLASEQPYLKLYAAYFGARWASRLLGHANKPGEVLKDRVALEAARQFFTQDVER